MKTSAKPTSSVRRLLERLSHRPAKGETLRVTTSGSEVGHTCARWGRGQRKAQAHKAQAHKAQAHKAQAPEAVAQGVIRHEVVSLLARFGTSYGLVDEWSADYECVLKSEAYRLGEYVGDRVWVSGPLTAVIGEMPVMEEVTHLELLKMKWMG